MEVVAEAVEVMEAKVEGAVAVVAAADDEISVPRKLEALRRRDEENNPRNLLFQWHITERCNLRCSHCYQEAYSGKELEFHDLLDILNQFKNLLDTTSQKNPSARAHITVTGGEPFIRQDFLNLLDILSSNRECFSFAILTNGSFIDASMARRLRDLGPAFVQVSIEGTQATHDIIRGKGNFERTISAIKHLVRERIRTFISFTAYRTNFREFSNVARIGRQLGVSRVWADRHIPCGSGSAIREQMLTPDETRKLFEIMYRERNKVALFNRTEISMHRALQFLVAGGRPYHCTAGDTLITVMPNGDVYPCRRMPIRIGNLMERPLIDLYNESDIFQALRDKQRVSRGCEGCFYSGLCRGGLKCLSYAITGDFFKADPGCWYASTKRYE